MTIKTIDLKILQGSFSLQKKTSVAKKATTLLLLFPPCFILMSVYFTVFVLKVDNIFLKALLKNFLRLEEGNLQKK